MDYKSKSGYSLAYKRKEIMYFSIGAVIIILLLLIFMPKPIGFYLSIGVLILAFIFISLGFLIMKTIQGVVTKIEGNTLSIYKNNSKFAETATNEALFNFYVGIVHAKCNISLNNIKNIRKISDPSEIEKIKKQTKTYTTAYTKVGGSGGKIYGAGTIILSLSARDVSAQEFVTDYSNIVELTLKKLKITKNIQAGKSKKEVIDNAKILVSIKNPDEFIQLVRK